MNSKTEGYVSSPVEIFKLSVKALGVNVGPLIAVVFLPLVVVLPVIALGFGIAALAKSISEPWAVVAIIIAVAAILALLVLLMLVSLAAYPVMLANAKGEVITFKSAFNTAKKKAWPLVWTSFLGGIAVAVGAVFLIVPGILFAIWFSLASYVVMEENLIGVAALKRSKQLVQGNALEVVGILALSVVAYIIATFVPLAGDILSLVVSLAVSVALAMRYLAIKKIKDSGNSVPKSHSSNWLFIVLIPVILALGVLLVINGVLKDPNKPSDENPINKIDFTLSR